MQKTYSLVNYQVAYLKPMRPHGCDIYNYAAYMAIATKFSLPLTSSWATILEMCIALLQETPRF